LTLTAIERVDVTTAARELWWGKKGDLLASAIAAGVLLVVGAVSGALPLAVTLAALTAGNVLRLFVRQTVTARNDREVYAYFAEFAEFATIGHTPANGDEADV
jgi:hypothetical protein